MRYFCLCTVGILAMLAAERGEAQGEQPKETSAMPVEAIEQPRVTVEMVREKLDLARRSLEYVQKIAPRPELATELRVALPENLWVD